MGVGDLTPPLQYRGVHAHCVPENVLPLLGGSEEILVYSRARGRMATGARIQVNAARKGQGLRAGMSLRAGIFVATAG